jgi:hypothetical protein
MNLKPDERKVYHVFLTSPGDVNQERQVVLSRECALGSRATLD